LTLLTRAEFQDVMDEYFLKNYESYVKLIVEKAALFDGKNMEVSLFNRNSYYNTRLKLFIGSVRRVTRRFQLQSYIEPIRRNQNKSGS
jgi:hypothetical protein